MYESIVKGEYSLQPGLPESFNVMMRELQSLALDVELVEQSDSKSADYDESLKVKDSNSGRKVLLSQDSGGTDGDVDSAKLFSDTFSSFEGGVDRF
jgi:hypothetical protein